MFLYSVWRSTALPTRIRIAQTFGIAKIGPTHVRDNYIESDGYKIEDVERSLNVDVLQKFTGLDSTDMAVLFAAVVATLKVNPEDLKPKIDPNVAESNAKPEKGKIPEVPKKKRGRPAKNK